jgi:hypothetical protein
MNLFSSDPSESRSPRLWLSVAATAVFLLLAGFGALRHEFWRDEMQAWLIARDAAGVPGIVEQAHYEGAPPLLPLVMRPVALLSHRPEAMQALNWILAGCTFFVVFHFFPLGLIPRALFILNYYLLFEYGIVCRNYLLGILALFVACLLFHSKRGRPWLFSAALVVAGLASVHSLIVAVAMATAFWGGKWWRIFANRRRQDGGVEALDHGPLALFAAGAAWAAYSMMPRADTFYSPAVGWSFGWDPTKLARVAWAFVCSHFSWPRPPGFFWIPSWHTPFPSFDDRVAFVYSASLLIGIVICLRRRIEALVFYFVSVAGLFLFLYSKYLGFTRHTGFFFISFFLAYWLAQAKAPTLESGAARWINRFAALGLIAMLTTQAITGVWALREDASRPFSCGKAAAELLKSRHLDQAFIAVGPDWAGSPLAGYLDRTLFYPQGRRYGSYTLWDTRREEGLSDAEVLQRAIFEARGRQMVIALDHPLAAEDLEIHGISTLAHIGGSMTPFEDYFLFTRPADPAAAGG